jgi:hypothetical protein
MTSAIGSTHAWHAPGRNAGNVLAPPEAGPEFWYHLTRRDTPTPAGAQASPPTPAAAPAPVPASAPHPLAANPSPVASAVPPETRQAVAAAPISRPAPPPEAGLEFRYSEPPRQATPEIRPTEPRGEGLAAGIPIDIFGFKPFGEDGLTLSDLVDVVNPLQHIPIVSSIYRRLTGDTIDPVPRLAGSGLLWGPFGVVVAAVNVAVEMATGRDLGDHAVAFVMGEPDDATRVASADGSAPATATAWTQPVREAQAFAFTPPAVEPTRASFVATPVAVEELPAGILAALEGGRPLNPLAAQEPAAPKQDVKSPPATQSAAAAAKAMHAKAAAEADAFAALRLRRNALTAAEQKKRPASRFSAGDDGLPAPGAAAAGGGWFSSAMLEALARYEETAKLGEPQKTPALDLAH